MTATRTRAAGLAGAAAVITVLTILSRIAGFGRTFVFLHTVGDGALGNVYNAANTIPNIVFELVAGGALASLVVPLIAGPLASGDRVRVSKVASALLTWVLTLMVPLAVLVAVLAGPIAALLNVPDGGQEVAARMLRVYAPQLPLYGVSIVLTGVLQAHHRFAWPVIAPLLSSVTVMGAYLSYAVVDGTRTDLGGLSRTGEMLLSLGTTAGVAVLALCLLIPLRRLKLRWRPSLHFPGDEGRQAVRLGWAGAVTVGSQQVMVLVVLLLSADGPLTAYNAAQTIFLLPWAVLAVPLATAVYPRLATAAARHDDEGYASALQGTARTVVLLAGLGAAGIAALAWPVAYLVGTQRAASGIVAFAPGLLGYALFALLSRALYARGATVAAASATAVGWGVAALAALVSAAVLPQQRELAGLGAANAIGMSVIGLLLVAAVRRHAGPAALAGLGKSCLVAVGAAVVAGFAGWFAAGLIGGTPGAGRSLLQGMLGAVVVALVYLAVVYPLAGRDLSRLLRRGRS
ncbi:murein biosynthesis integral membrane protein MurJ [Actinoplanes sp. TFC3]|uniref:murein biosynthesis integral membrane protein MurJ n=1 Tax=Actinoplanes sp. TFC3 TaxID=1710355 RepID=UPI00082C01D1|nr:lipid II flippase MurJ [Actinoplanes sp. TFC3]